MISLINSENNSNFVSKFTTPFLAEIIEKFGTEKILNEITIIQNLQEKNNAEKTFFQEFLDYLIIKDLITIDFALEKLQNNQKIITCKQKIDNEYISNILTNELKLNKNISNESNYFVENTFDYSSECNEIDI